jgi:hypothetical protein
MACIGLHYSNSSIFNLEYKEANIKETGYGTIDIVHSNILKEVEFVLQNTSNKDEFNNYFLGNNFLSNIKDISKSDLNGTLVSIPTKIEVDNINGFLKFDIISTVKDDVYIKKFQASVKIKNPFFTQVANEKNESIEEDGKEEKSTNLDILDKNLLYEYKEESREFNINETVIVYNYKEI